MRRLHGGVPIPISTTEIFSASAPSRLRTSFSSSPGSPGHGADGPVAVTVVRSGPTTAAASVDYGVQSGTAKAGTDFTPTSGTLNFAAGQASQTFTVPLNPDDEFSGTRTAELVLSNPQGGSLGSPVGGVNLTANPPPSSPPTTQPTHVSMRTSSPTPTIAPTPSPMITSVTPVKSRGGVEKLAITFAQALDPTSAENVNSYGVSILAHAQHRHGKQSTADESRRSIGVASAVYDAADHQVTLTLHAKLHGRQTVQLQLKNAAGNVAGRHPRNFDQRSRSRVTRLVSHGCSVSYRSSSEKRWV